VPSSKLLIAWLHPSHACSPQVYGLLDEEFKQGLHALSMVLKTPSEKEKQ